MGRRICPSNRYALARPACLGWVRVAAGLRGWLLALALLLSTFATLIGPVSPVLAQTQGQTTAHAQPQGQPNADAPGAKPKMLIQADELVDNKDKHTVTAQGNARIYYKNRILQADKVVFDRVTTRVYAEGHASLTEPDGTVLHSNRFDLTQDFADGFIDSLRAETADKTYFSAPRAERSGNNVTVYEKGTYTACASCAENPEKPPLWRVRAMRIIHNQDEQMVYYTDAWLEFVGVPVAYFPFLSSPDPTVKRKSGLLIPNVIQNGYLGYGFSQPIFWALAPNYDVTLTPTYFTRQGFFGDAYFRHRLATGSYYVRANGIFPQNPNAFPQSPYGASDRSFRGEIESRGDFLLAPNWNAGWAFTVMTDKWYYNDFKVPQANTSGYYVSDLTSTAYLVGQSSRSYFDLRGFYFEGLTSHDLSQQNTTAAPVLDYNRTFDIDPARTRGVGGQVTVDFNLSNVSAAAANYQSVGLQQYDAAFGLYNICKSYTPGTTSSNCLLRGIAGDYSRVTADVSWQRKYIDPIGEVWTPFAFARLNGQALDLNTSSSFTFSSSNGTSTISNASQTNFGVNSGAFGYVMPGVGMEWRYPFITQAPFGSFEAEPIAQIIARPNSLLGNASPVNIDAQSLVFDTTNLFAWDKYSGYDLYETGVRANYGAQATYRLNSGGYVNAMFGQSAQIAGTNPYTTFNAANIGLSSGLDTPWSNYVASFTLVPSSLLNFTTQEQFDQSTFEVKRVDVGTNINLGAWTGGIQYANYQAQPVIGYFVRREGLALSSSYKITDKYFVAGNISFDMSRQFYPPPYVSFNPGPFSISSFGLLGGYKDDCTTFQLSYTNNYVDNGTGSFNHNQTIAVSLQLRTLGDTSFSHNFLTTANGQALGGD
jgi:LPS-assembly protein